MIPSMSDQGAVAVQKAEQRALKLSLAVSGGVAVVAAIWGLMAGSMVIILDAVFLPLSLSLTYGSIVISRIVARGPTRRFPFGRSALVPLFVITQAVVLFVLLGYASLEAVRVILGGGSEVSGAALVGYGLFSTIVSVIVWMVLLRMANGQALVEAEAAGWLSGLVSSLGVALGGIFVIAVRGTSLEHLAPFADSALVLFTSVLLMAIPLNLMRKSVRDLQNPMPDAEMTRVVQDLVADVSAAEGLPEPIQRIGLMGRELMVELGYVLEPGQGDIRCEDRVREAVRAGLNELPVEPWVVVEFSYQRELIE